MIAQRFYSKNDTITQNQQRTTINILTNHGPELGNFIVKLKLKCPYDLDK